MIEGLQHSFPPDAIELALVDAARAKAEIANRRPDILALFVRRRTLLAEQFGTLVADAWDRAEAALCLSLARLAIRHGRFGSDYHHYHNEEHALEILDRRIERVMRELGVRALDGLDWIALTLFATCHDLRQRELVDSGHPIGSNEAASIAETHRILEQCGFQHERDHELFLALEIMIAGSTFDARPTPIDRSKYNTAEVIATSGPLAPHLARELDRINAAWRSEAGLDRSIRLALIASDLDTANVGESFIELSDSGARLAGEREMRAGRRIESPESGPTLLSFLSTGQERYFFELHRFCSDVGEKVYGPGKAANADKVRRSSVLLRERFQNREPGSFTGTDVLDAQREIAWQLT